MNNSQRLILGIDGGGTKTVCWLARRDAAADEVLGRGRAGPSNLSAVGFERAMQSVEAAIDSALSDAGCRREDVETACIGLAGSSCESEFKRVPAWLRQRRLARRVILTDDAAPILACAAPQDWGAALISGTGSFLLARNQRGDTARVGGWGFRFGDEGSGYAIAIAGLTAAARAADGRAPPTELLELFLADFGADHPRQLIEKVYQSDVDRRALADRARLVLGAAARDVTADRIVSQAAAALAEMVQAARTRLSLPDALPLGFAGGALLGSQLLRDRVLDQLQRAGVHPHPLSLVTDPVRGALLLARSG